MSTWAARLSAHSASSDRHDASGRDSCASCDTQATTTMVPLLHHACASASADAVQYAHTPPRGRRRGGAAARRARAARAATVTTAAVDVASTAAAALQLPPDCWAHVVSFLSYTDVCHMLRVCTALHTCLAHREAVWRTQLQYFHADMRDMRGSNSSSSSNNNNNSSSAASCGSALLTMTFALPACAHDDSYARLRCERRLYSVDAQREWHFRDVAAHDETDRTLGMFSVPLQLHDSDADGNGRDVSDTTTTTTSSHTSSLQLTILQPQRDADDDDEVATAAEQAQAQPQNDEEAEGVDVDALDEEAALQRAIALSLREHEERQQHQQHADEDDAVVVVQRRHTTRTGRALREHELMTLVDCLNRGDAGLSRIAVRDVTTAQDGRFVRALTTTLAAALQRRSHRQGELASHEAARRACVWRAREPATTSSAAHDDNNNDDAVHEPRRYFLHVMPYYGMRHAAMMPRHRAAAAAAAPPRTLQCMLCRFHGQLLEITREEAHRVCASLLRRPDVLHDLELFDGYADDTASAAGNRHATTAANEDVAARLRATTRFFLAPELCTCGTMGLVVVDAVRVLVLVDAEATELSGRRGGGADGAHSHRTTASAAATVARDDGGRAVPSSSGGNHNTTFASTTVMTNNNNSNSTSQRALLHDESVTDVDSGGVARLTSGGRLVLPGRGMNAQVWL